jgi:hypothetical protein
MESHSGLVFQEHLFILQETNVSNDKAEIHKFVSGSSLAAKFLEKDMGTIAA